MEDFMEEVYMSITCKLKFYVLDMYNTWFSRDVTKF